MARKKASSEDIEENPDDASVDAEVTDEGYDEPAMADPALMKNPKVNLKDKPDKKEAPVSETTKAEQEAGRKAVQGKSADKPPPEPGDANVS
jgi:hypothetical protein